jgi:hypothetical protein
MRTFLHKVCTRTLILFLLARTAQALCISECGELAENEYCLSVLDCENPYDAETGEELICYVQSFPDTDKLGPLIPISLEGFNYNYEEVL